MRPRTLAAIIWLALALTAWLSFNGFAWAGGTGFGSGFAEGLNQAADQLACQQQFTDPIVQQQCILQKQQMRAQQRQWDEFWRKQQDPVICMPFGRGLICR